MRTEYYSPTTGGGLMSFAQGMLGGMKSLGHQYSILASAKLPVEGAEEEFYLPYNKHLLNLPEVYHLAYNEKIFPFIKKVLKERSYDFVYLRHSAFNYIGAMIKKKIGAKVILQVDGSEVWVKKNWGKTFLTRPLELCEQIQFENCDALAVFSDVLKQKFIRQGIPEKKIFVVPSGVNPNNFDETTDGTDLRNKYCFSKNNFVIGFAGSFGLFHGVEVLAKAFKYINQAIPESRLLLVGDGDTRGEVEEILIKDNMREKAIITGMVPLKIVPEHLAACDMLVLPSVNNSDGSEFFCSPIKLFEYMAMAKPIVASAIGQIKDVIQEGRNGFLVPEKDPELLAEKIIEAYKLNKNKLLEIGHVARIDVLNEYTWQSSAQKIINIAQGL